MAAELVMKFRAAKLSRILKDSLQNSLLKIHTSRAVHYSKVIDLHSIMADAGRMGTEEDAIHWPIETQNILMGILTGAGFTNDQHLEKEFSLSGGSSGAGWDSAIGAGGRTWGAGTRGFPRRN